MQNKMMVNKGELVLFCRSHLGTNLFIYLFIYLLFSHNKDYTMFQSSGQFHKVSPQHLKNEKTGKNN